MREWFIIETTATPTARKMGYRSSPDIEANPIFTYSPFGKYIRNQTESQIISERTIPITEIIELVFILFAFIEKAIINVIIRHTMQLISQMFAPITRSNA